MGARLAEAASYGWAYVRADRALDFYVPDDTDQFNVATLSAANTVRRVGVGAYVVGLPNLGDRAGTVHVTAYGPFTADYCNVLSWGPSGTTQNVNVRCFDAGGAPINTHFTMTYARPWATTDPTVYAWADNPTAKSYTPHTNYQFNSTGAINTISRSAVGEYTVALPLLGSNSGHVQVTAYGPGGNRCTVAFWGPSGSGQLVRVRCFSAKGAATDARFTMTYASGTSIVGSSCCGGGPSTSSAYIWSGGAPQYQYNSSSLSPSTITRVSTGY